jgi:large repetitive protein
LWVNNFQGVAAPSGNQFAELNAQASSALYQDILVFANEAIPWSAAHRGRQSNTVADVAEVSISDPLNWNGATFNGTKLYSAKLATSKNGSISTITPVLGHVANSEARETLANGWAKYIDTWAGPSASKEYRFAFQSSSTGSGNPTIGNFLDNIQIKLSPIVDLADPKIAEINPSSNSIYYLPIRMNGKSESVATVEIDVSLGGADYTDYTLEALASGTNAAVANGITATKLGNGNIQVTIPTNLYDPNNPSHYITVPINFSKASASQDKLAQFNIVSVNGGGGLGVQDLLKPPADSAIYGFATLRQTTVKAALSD